MDSNKNSVACADKILEMRIAKIAAFKEEPNLLQTAGLVTVPNNQVTIFHNLSRINKTRTTLLLRSSGALDRMEKTPIPAPFLA
jgi:pyrimidine deaminase RibD-like protein